MPLARAWGDEAKQKQEIEPITDPAETNFMQEKKTRECKRDSTYVNMQQKKTTNVFYIFKKNLK